MAISRLLSLPETAARLSLSIRTVRRWATEGRFPIVRLGGRILVDPDELETWIRDRSIPANALEGRVK